MIPGNGKDLRETPANLDQFRRAGLRYRYHSSGYAIWAVEHIGHGVLASGMLFNRLGFGAAALFFVANASAVPMRYNLVGVQFNDGGTASGSFAYDPATNLYSNVNITTTTGTARTGATYRYVCGQDVPTCIGIHPGPGFSLDLTTTAADQTGDPYLLLMFPGGLGTTTSFDLSSSEVIEANCSNAGCTGTTGPTRSSVAGEAVALLDEFQIRYSANLNIGDAYLDITNSGASNGNICVNVYTFDPAEELISCCTCNVTPNGLQSLSVVNSLISNPLTPAIPTAVVVKLVASSGTCNAAVIKPINLAVGMLAWGTSLHAQATTPVSYGVTETAFSQAFLSDAELAHITSTCGFIQADGSKFGICSGCAAGALGASASNE